MSSEPCSFCGSTDPDHICPGANALLVGKVLDNRYRIDEILGEGGMGMVFRATQTSMSRPVAVKTLHATLATSPQFFERFRREAETASRLKHPNVITVFDFGRTPDGTCYFVMELLEGVSLKQLVVEEGPLSIRRAVNIIEQAARGLVHAHAMGCVHRDLKPHNIMVQLLDGVEYVKVLDFGLVKALEQGEDDAKLTSTGQVLGTPQYMPPEQAGGEEVDQRSDIYSLGGVLFFCLTGTSPYGAKTVRKALSAALTQPVPSVNSKRQGAPVPRVVDEFLRKALAKEKKDRHQNAEEFIQDLLDSIAGLPDDVLDATPGRPEEGASAGSGSKSSKDSRSSKDSKSSGGKPRRPPPPPGRGSLAPSQRVVVDPQMTISRPRETTPEIPRVRLSKEVPLPPLVDGSKRRKVLIAVAIAVVALLGATAFLWPKSPPPVAATQQLQVTPPKTNPTPSKIAVTINSTPAGALILEDGQAIGQTPATFSLAREGTHAFELRLSGYQAKQFAPADLANWKSSSLILDAALLPVQPQKTPVKPKHGHRDDIPVFE